MGGGSERARRIARIADGWLPHFAPARRRRRSTGSTGWFARPAAIRAFGIEGRMALSQIPERRVGQGPIEAWRAMHGITHLCVNTMGMGLEKPDSHIEALRRFKEAAIR